MIQLLSRSPWKTYNFCNITGSYSELLKFVFSENRVSRSRWSGGLRRRFVDARFLESSVRIPTGTWMPVSCECCLLSGRGICDGPIPSPEKA